MLTSMGSMRLSIQIVSGWKCVAAGGMGIWLRETIRQAVTTVNESIGHERPIWISPLSDTWLRRLEEESSKHSADS